MDILNQMGVKAVMNRIEVNTNEEAVQHSFPGSPTIRINGRDIDSKGAQELRVGLSCRIYHDENGKITPLPPEGIIRDAIHKETESGGIS